MKKYILSLLLLCLSLHSHADEKQALIDKANAGDIHAMLSLSQDYLFPQTAQGLEHFNSWYPLVLASDDLVAIDAFTQIMQDKQNMFLDGENKVTRLKKRLIQLGSQKALLQLLKTYNHSRQQQLKKLQALMEEVIANRDQNQLMTLYNYCLLRYQDDIILRIKAELRQSADKYYASLSDEDRLVYLDLLSYFEIEKKAEEFEKRVAKIYASDNTYLIAGIAKLYADNFDWALAVKFYERVIELDTKNVAAYEQLIELYPEVASDLGDADNKKREEIAQKRERLLKPAALLDSYLATKILLAQYKEKKNAQAFLDLKQQIVKLKAAKMALADYYLEDVFFWAAYELYNELAEAGYDNARIKLATQLKASESYNPIFYPELEQFISTWRDFILSDAKPYLVDRLRVKAGGYQGPKGLAEQVAQQQMQNNNLQVLKITAKDADEPALYLEKAASLGDIDAQYLLASEYGRLAERNSDRAWFEKGLLIYDELEKKGDDKVYIERARYYASFAWPRAPKSVVYNYEKAYEKGDESAIAGILSYYLCESCNIYDEKKVDHYLAEAIDLRRFKYISYLGDKYRYAMPKIAKAYQDKGYSNLAKIWYDELELNNNLSH